ncbi:MAG: hypothetical protein AB1Z57_04320 [Acidimicrobiia bacterium]
MSDPASDADTEGVGCRPIVEALAVFGGLLAVGSLLLFGADPQTVGVVRAFVFFLGAPATAALQFLSSGGFAFAWPFDVLVWALVSVWAARAGDRRAWLVRVAVALGVSAVLAVAAVGGLGG